MPMPPTSRVTSKVRPRSPAKSGEKLSLKPGDVVVYELEDDDVRLRKQAPLDVAYLRALQTTLSEWDPPRMLQPSTIFEPFEIAIVPFPFVDLPKTKPRPALVLSMGRFNRQNGHTLLAMITSAEQASWPSDYAIKDLRPTGLRIACVVRWKLSRWTTASWGGGLAAERSRPDSPVALLLDASSMRRRRH